MQVQELSVVQPIQEECARASVPRLRSPGRVTVRSRLRRLRKQTRQAYVRLMRSPGAPKEIAGGLAVGIFVAMLPLIQMPVAVGLAVLAGRLLHMRLSTVAAAAGVWITNPITGAPLYGLAFLLGRPWARWILPDAWISGAEVPLSLADLTSAGPLAIEAGASLVLGGVALGIPMAWLGYTIALTMVTRYQARRLARRARRFA